MPAEKKTDDGPSRFPFNWRLDVQWVLLVWIISKIFRIRVSNFSPNFDKPKFVELLNSMFSDIKSIDFQPRYNEKGRLFGCLLSFRVTIRFVTFTSEIGYNECLQLGTYTFGDDELRIEPGQDKGTMPTSVSLSPPLSFQTTLVLKNVPLSVTDAQFLDWIVSFLLFLLTHSANKPSPRSPSPSSPPSRTTNRPSSPAPSSFSTATSKTPASYLFLLFPHSSQAWGYLKDEQFAGAKLEVEYKKKQDKREFESAFKPVFLSAVAEQLWKQLTQFKERFVGQNPRGPVPSLVFPNDLSA